MTDKNCDIMYINLAKWKQNVSEKRKEKNIWVSKKSNTTHRVNLHDDVPTNYSGLLQILFYEMFWTIFIRVKRKIK